MNDHHPNCVACGTGEYAGLSDDEKWSRFYHNSARDAQRNADWKRGRLSGEEDARARAIRAVVAAQWINAMSLASHDPITDAVYPWTDVADNFQDDAAFAEQIVDGVLP